MNGVIVVWGRCPCGGGYRRGGHPVQKREMLGLWFVVLHVMANILSKGIVRIQKC